MIASRVRTWPWAAAMIGLLVLGGCTPRPATPSLDAEPMLTEPRPEVAVHRETVVVPVGPDGRVGDDAARRITTLVQRYASPERAHGRIATRIAETDQIRTVLRAAGVPADRITSAADRASAAVPPDQARVTLRQYEVIGPHCGRPARMGCSTVANLTTMVHDPGDLRRGRQLAPAPATRAARPVADYLDRPTGDDARTAGDSSRDGGAGGLQDAVQNLSDGASSGTAALGGAP